MGKYSNIPSTISSTSSLPLGIISRTARNLIPAVSLICGILTLGVSIAFLSEINQAGGKTEENEGPPLLGATLVPKENVKMFVVICSVGIAAVILQVFTSVGFWVLKDKESKPFLLLFAIGQGIIQGILLICLALVIHHYLLYPKRVVGDSVGSPINSRSPRGHGFWILLALNVLFHIGAISFLLHRVMRGTEEERMEEMTTVVIHRRIPSRIPSERKKSSGHSSKKRHARMQMQIQK